MKWICIAFFSMLSAFMLADFLFSQVNTPVRNGSERIEGAVYIPFKHALHGKSIGLDCVNCHSGVRSEGHAFFPNKADCMDCHRLPLTENPGIETLDSALASAPDYPWGKTSSLPEHVVFHHGVHYAAGVACDDCHGVRTLGRVNGDGYKNDVYGGESFSMQTCVNCHRGVTFAEKGFLKASVECAACHR